MPVQEGVFVQTIGFVFVEESKQTKPDLVSGWKVVGKCFGVASSPLAGVWWLLQPRLCFCGQTLHCIPAASVQDFPSITRDILHFLCACL